jgi:hypothetical protein
MIKIKEIWIRFGEIIGRVSNKIILSILFFAIITPVTIITKVFGRDIFCMSCKYASYWIEHNQEELTLDFFKQQF